MRNQRKQSRLFDTLVPQSILGMKSFFELYADEPAATPAPKLAKKPAPAPRQIRGRIW